MANTLQTKLIINADVQGTNEVNQLANSLGQVGNELNQTAQPASTTAQALGNVVKSANHTHHSTTTLSQSIAQVNASFANTATPVQTASTAMGSLTYATNQSTTAVSQLDNAMGSVRSAFGGLQGLLTTLGVGVGVAEIIQLSDEFNNLEARVKLATNTGGDFNAAMTRIKDIADGARMPLTATGELFTKLSTATKELGYSQSEVLDLTQTISQAMAVSGGDMASMEAGLTQLAQGLSAGALRGDELNSVLEQSPRLAQALADGLGISIGGLKELGAEGKITAEVVGNALKSQADVIAQEFAQMPATVSGSLTVLKNSLMGFIGELDNEIQGSSGLANFITQIADNINHIDPSVIEGLKNALTSAGVVAQTLYDSLAIIPNALGDVTGAMVGMEAGAGQISIIQGLMNGLALGTGAVADGFKALQIIITGVMAAVQTHIANTANTLYKLTGLGGEFAKSMTDSAKKTQDEFEKLAIGFESSLTKAMDSIAKGADGKLQEMADNARQKYEQMANDGKASTAELENAFKDYAHKAIEANNGVVDATLKQELAQKGLQAIIDDTGKVTISAMDNAQKAVDGVDLSKHAESFKALGIDMSEFAGGLSSKVNTALAAFNDLAKVAGNNASQLAQAYNGAKQAIGDNAQGLAELDKALMQAVGDSTSLAQGVKALAHEQQNAKTATTDQQKALQALGVEMNAINQGMSQSGHKMAESLKVGITAIKEQATSAESLKVALKQALDTSLAAAKTQADFKAIKAVIDEAGISGKVTAEQMAKINAGAVGGSDAVQQLAEATKAHTTSVNTNTQATAQNTTAKADNAKATEDIAKAEEKAGQASTSRLTTYKRHAPAWVASVEQQISKLQELGATQEQVTALTEQMHRTMSMMPSASIYQMAQSSARLSKEIADQANHFDKAKQAAVHWTSVLGKAEVSSNDLGRAQLALRNATNASINGIIRMDNQTLSGLQNAIDNTRRKMRDLADDAKKTTDNLEASLARLKGDDITAKKIEQTQKLTELTERLNQARTRNNTAEIQQLSRALELQRQINAEELRQARQQQQAQRQQSNSSNNRNTNNSTNTNNTINAKDIANAWDDRIEQAKKQAVADFAQQLRNESKRRAR